MNPKQENNASYSRCEAYKTATDYESFINLGKVGSCGGRILDLSRLVTFALGPVTKSTRGRVPILLTDKS